MTDLTDGDGIPEKLHLIRHARPIISDLPRSEWPLDPAHTDALTRLKETLDVPYSATWYCSPERRAVETAEGLTTSSITIVEALGEMGRPPTFIEDFEDAVARAFAEPGMPGSADWETVNSVAARQRKAVREFDGVGETVVVGHGVALTTLVSVLTDQPPDFESWKSMRMPDYAVVQSAKLVRAWGDWS